jgi:hypothetical protein
VTISTITGGTAMSIHFDELHSEQRPGGASSRRRWFAVVGAAMLIAVAAGAGYGIGRSADDGSVSTSPEEETSDEAAPQSEAATSEAETPDVDSTPPTVDAPLAESADSGGITASGGMGWAMFGYEPLELLFDRTTADGLTLRAHRGPIWEQDVGVPEGEWQPAPWCYESGQLRVALGGNGVIDVGSVPWYSEPYQGRSVSWVTLGNADGQPTWVFVAQVPTDTENVVVTLGSGETDAAAPQNGIAVLAVPGVGPEEVVEGSERYWVDNAPVFSVEVQGGAAAGVVDSGRLGTWDDPVFRESCTPPPPALPDAGEQPADPAAAEAEIRAAMTALYGVVGTDDVGSDLIDDPTGVAEARQQVQDGDFAEDAAGASATIDELVFTAPDEAWFRYSIDTPGNDFDNRYGIAVLVDGVWKITRSTVCQDLSLAGGDCGGGWQQIYPPSALPEIGGDVEVITVPED